MAQPTKQAWLYVFDRETGEPIWPIEERAVEASNVPGELLAPTQPFPTKPPAYDRQGVDLDALVDFTPEIRRRAEEIAARHRMGPIFSPPVVSDAAGPYGTLMLPSQTGGTNWPGGSIDPETGIAYLYSFTRIGALRLINDPERSDMNYISGRAREIPAAQAALNVDGIPLVKPPWGRITAVDLTRGEILWQIAHGATPDNIRNHPLLEGVTVPRTGRIGRVGTLITRTLVIAGEAGTFTTESGEEGAMLRAYDKASGEERGAVFMPAGGDRLADDLYARGTAVHRPGDQRRRVSRRADRLSPAGIVRAPSSSGVVARRDTDRSALGSVSGQRLITNDSGLPSSVIRFKTLHARHVSTCRLWSLRARRPSPTIRLYRKNAFSTRACR